MNKALQLLLFIAAALFTAGCYDNPADNPLGNQPPKTSLFLKPDSSISSQPSRIHIHWSGDDPDGFVIGFYFTWDDQNWTFTPASDSIFALQIGAADTTYKFRVAAVDNGGNGVYDNNITQNGINFGPEPFIDGNGSGTYDAGETFYDIGLIDKNPAELPFPIRNSAPTVNWNQLSVLPDTSFPVMSFGWEAADLDGDQSIMHINIALNDTNTFTSLNGEVRRVTLRTNNFDNPLMDILIEGNSGNIAAEKLAGLKLNDNNKFYVQAVDISGAKSPFIALPGEDKNWFVKRPKGDIIIIDDMVAGAEAQTFYDLMMDSLGLSSRYNTYSLLTQTPPFLNITFLETIKLFKYAIWYSDNNPSLDLANASTQKYLDAGGKILFSTQFPQEVDLTALQGFLPIEADSSSFRNVLAPNAVISSAAGYPELTTTGTLFRARSFYLAGVGVDPVYSFPNNELAGYIGFRYSSRNLFFIGLPLHRLNGGSANVKQFLNKVLFEDFGLIP